MDWSRAKSILILSFLLLNLMLGYELWADKWSLSLSRSETAMITEEVNRLLRLKSIQMEAAIPKDVPKLQEIVVSEDETNRSIIETPLNPPVKYVNTGRNGLPADSLKRVIAHFSSYQVDPLLSGEGRLVMNQMHGDFPIFEVHLELLVEGGMITAYRQDYAAVESNPKQQEQKVIPAHTALRSLVENYLPENAVIRDIRLGYRGRFQLMLPNWRITLGDGSVYYVNAFTGAVEAPQGKESEAAAGD